MKVLHVLNYGWPYIDGYTARSIGLVGAQAEHLDGVEPAVATSPFAPLAHGRDEAFRTPHWGPELQLRATRRRAGEPLGPRAWERPAVGLAPATSAMFRAELESVVRRTGAELVHVHHPHYVAGPALDVARALGLPAVFELRCFNGYYDLGTGSPLRSARGHLQNALEFALAREASATVTIADGLAATLLRAGVAEDRLFVVRNSVDTSRFDASGRDAGFGERLAADAAGGGDGGVDGGGTVLRVGYATTFERIENLDEAVRAAALAAPRLAARGVRLELALAGTGRDHPRIAALVDELELGATVRLPGLVPYADMPGFYRSLDLFLVPRGAHAVSMDTTPLKPLEALACGCPMIVTDLPAMRELLAHRSDVRFTAPDADAMAEAILAFADAPHAGVGHVPERAWPLEVQRYAEVYARAREHGPPRPVGRRAAVRALGSARAELAADVRRGVGALLDRRAPATDRAGDAAGSAVLHLVVCGYPRSGSTLLQTMLEHSVTPLRRFAGEVEALDVLDARAPGGRRLTKYPDDVLRASRIAEALAGRGDGARFALGVRDPRDVVTSVHAAYGAARGYYVGPERFARTTAALLEARERDDALVVRYEDLVADPSGASAALARLTGWPIPPGFGPWYERARTAALDSMTDGALGGLRRPETGAVARWRAPEHRERLAALVAGCPALLEACTALGYEPDDAWADAYREPAPRAAGAAG